MSNTESQKALVQRVLDFLEPIPEGKWCAGTVADVDGKCCAMGHLGAKSGYSLCELDENPSELLKDVFNSDFKLNIKLIANNDAHWHANLADATQRTNGAAAKKGVIDFLRGFLADIR